MEAIENRDVRAGGTTPTNRLLPTVSIPVLFLTPT